MKKTHIGIVGCGAIGTGIAKRIQKEWKKSFCINALYDIDKEKTCALANKLHRQDIVASTLNSLIKKCDLIVEAVSSNNIRSIIKPALLAKKSVLVMSIGQMLSAPDLFKLAEKNKCHLLLPSGAIGGLDAIKAGSLEKISKITLTTRKPPRGLANARYVIEKGIDLSHIKKETIIFEGDVKRAVKYFPRNINVAATLALASRAKNKMKIRIITSPQFKTNSHEIVVEGSFGRLMTRTDNVPCPDNPKTSYLAVLSALQTLKQHVNFIKIGT
ncbi:MAG: aspartate dehydrogenase [Candidatus Omnitrophota bacterium]